MVVPATTSRVAVFMITTVAVIVAMVVILPMTMIVVMAVIVRMRFVMRMTVTIAMSLRKHLLRQRVVFFERRIVPMPMPAAIGTGFRMERQRRTLDLRAQSRQHGLQHRIGFELQIIDTDFDGGMAIAEMIGRARERDRIRRAHDEHSLGRGHDPNERTVVGH